MTDDTTSDTPRTGRPRKAPHERRDARFPDIRMTSAERDEAAAKAAAAGLSLSEFGRRAINGQRIEARATTADEAALAQLGRVAGNLAQIVRALNFGQSIPPDLLETVAAVREAAERIAGEGGR